MTRLRLRVPPATHVVAMLTLAFLALPFIVVMGASLDDGSAYRISFPPTKLSLGAYQAIPPAYLRGLGTSL